MKRNILYTTTCTLLFLIPAYAQQQQQQQQQPTTTAAAEGTYLTRLGDRLINTESYRIASQPDGSITAEAELTPPGGGAKQRVRTTVSKTRPESFSVEIGGAKTLEAKFGEGVVVTLNAAGSPAREVRTKATVVMENLVWHQFVFLLGQYEHARGGRQDFTAFLPSQGVEYPIQLEYVGAQTYTRKDRATVTTRRYKALAGGALMLDVWTDEARVPLLFQVTAQQIKVVRQGWENLAEVAFAAPAEYSPPGYVVPASFNEQELTLGADGEWPLPATLTLPAGKGSFPAVVLVHGSGPNDRDETLGGNKPFRDLAWGLASQGVAVLRYDKRTRRYPDKLSRLSNFTVREETTDDALAAVRLLRQTAGIDANKIYVLGHSLGGMLVPRIGAADARIAGFVVLAGPTRPLEDAFPRQYEYSALLDGRIDDAERAQIEDARRQAARIKQLKPGDAAGEILFYVPPSYWLDLRGYDPPQTARTLKRPMLILQGERDYNVTLDDFRNWRTALAAHREVEFKTYPKLDHFFYEGEGAASGADYDRPRNIPKYVIDDIAAWIKKRS
ncbi:MAG TPA: alpha/beta fold hydrolase [Pyrinomonadaceae bacterium]|nr:alpha/beta fold hydrolase [Pyrinomonadaceae bacterium]